MSKYKICRQQDGTCFVFKGTDAPSDPYQYFNGYDAMGSVNWEPNRFKQHMSMTMEEATQIVSDLEAADEPADPPRACAGYIIIQAIRLDPSHEIVIGHNPRAAAPYVCWDCRNGDDYNTGGYCSTYRQALLVLSERLHDRYDYLPREYREEA